MKIQEARDRIFVALDFGNSDKVASLVPYLVPYVGGFKIGLELISFPETMKAMWKIQLMPASMW